MSLEFFFSPSLLFEKRISTNRNDGWRNLLCCRPAFLHAIISTQEYFMRHLHEQHTSSIFSSMCCSIEISFRFIYLSLLICSVPVVRNSHHTHVPSYDFQIKLFFFFFSFIYRTIASVANERVRVSNWLCIFQFLNSLNPMVSERKRWKNK